VGDRFWPIAEVSLDEKRRAGKRSKAATQKFRAIISATDPTRKCGAISGGCVSEATPNSGRILFRSQMKYVRTSAGILMMILVVLTWYLWPREPNAQIVSGMAAVKARAALEAFCVFLIAALIAGYVARQRIVVLALMICLSLWAIEFLGLPGYRSSTFLEILALNAYGVGGSVVGTVLGSTLGNWLASRRTSVGIYTN
jgi:hypothetical protein